MGRIIQSIYNDKQFYTLNSIKITNLPIGDVITWVGSASNYVRYYNIVAGGTGIADDVNYIDLNNGNQAELFVDVVSTAITDSDGNVYIGSSALDSITPTYGDNIAIGDNSLRDLATGIENVSIGESTMLTATDSVRCVAVGHNAIYSDSSSSDLVAVGNDAMYSNTGGVQGVAIGSGALYSHTAPSYSVAVGYRTLYSYTNSEPQCAIGDRVLEDSVDDVGNTAMGYRAGFNIDAESDANNGNYNTIMGHQAAYTGTNYDSSVVIGYRAAYTEDCWDSVIIGYKAAYTGAGGSPSYSQMAIGYQALYSFSGSGSNTAIGMNSLYNLTSGSNTSVGNSAGFDLTSGTGNTLLGASTGAQLTTADDCICIGAGAGPTSGGGLTATDNQLYIDRQETNRPFIGGLMTGFPTTTAHVRMNAGLVFNDNNDQVSNNGEIQIIATSDTNIQIIHKGSDGTKRYGNITIA